MITIRNTYYLHGRVEFDVCASFTEALGTDVHEIAAIETGPNKFTVTLKDFTEETFTHDRFWVNVDAFCNTVKIEEAPF